MLYLFLLLFIGFVMTGGRPARYVFTGMASGGAMACFGYHAGAKRLLVYLSVFAAAWQWGVLPGDKLAGAAFADSPVVHVLSGPGEHLTIPNDGHDHLVYGTMGNNQVTAVKGAVAHLRHFPGVNTIHIQTDMAQCLVVRSGAMVTIRNPNDGTRVKMPATAEKQTLNFNGGSRNLQIIGGKVDLDGLQVNLTEQSLYQDAPLVDNTVPADGDADVGVGTSVTIHFSEPMDQSTLIPGNFVLEKVQTGGNQAIGFTLTKSSETAILLPDAPLEYNQSYLLKVKTGVKDQAGTPLSAEKIVIFTTTAQADTEPPVVDNTVPADGAVDVGVGTSVTIHFSEPMDQFTLIPGNFALEKVQTGGNQTIGFSLTKGSDTVELMPTTALENNQQYLLKVKTGVQDQAGNPLAAEKTIIFTTTIQTDTDPPVVDNTNPANGADDVGVGTSVTIHFSEPMDQSTLIAGNFVLEKIQTGGNQAIGFGLTKSSETVVLLPDAPLEYDKSYLLKVKTGVQDQAGNHLANEKSVYFTTMSQVDTDPPFVENTTPENNETGVVVNESITIHFNEPMDLVYLIPENFLLNRKVGYFVYPIGVEYTLQKSDTQVTLIPVEPLAYEAQYRLKVKTGVRDRAGNYLANEKTVLFTTENAPPLSPGDEMTIDLGNGVDLILVWIPAGSFYMGSNVNDSEKPRHEVTLTQGFWMGKYEVTQAQWEQIMGSNPSHFQGNDRPVEKVSWDDVQDFIAELNQATGQTFSLPTEAQWEYAARGDADPPQKYSGSDTVSQVGWYDGNSNDTTHSVGQKAANAWGLHDMSGNVYEWCQDWYDSDYYASSPSQDPTGPASGVKRVIRGGCWYSSAGSLRSASRNYSSPGLRSNSLGFRLVRMP